MNSRAAQSRANSAPARARLLAERHPAAYAAFDVLQHPAHGDGRGWSYVRRRALLEQVLGEDGMGPPIQAAPTTTAPHLVRVWHEALRGQGIEGLPVKGRATTYCAGSRQGKLLIGGAVAAVAIGTFVKSIIVALGPGWTGNETTLVHTLRAGRPPGRARRKACRAPAFRGLIPPPGRRCRDAPPPAV